MPTSKAKVFETTSIPSELSVKTFIDWYKKNKRRLNRQVAITSLMELQDEVEDFINDYAI